VHDEGGLLSFGRARAVLRDFGFDIRTLGQAAETAGPRGPLPWVAPIPLPFLWVNGRRDATISVMGSNIYPEDIETLVYRDPAILPRLESFMLTVRDDESGTPRPVIMLELTDLEGVDQPWLDAAADRLCDGLTGLNIDYRSSVVEFPAAMRPIVETFEPGGGPFAGDRTRIKQRRIVSH
jgi:phenylacetate-CoA ligase